MAIAPEKLPYNDPSIFIDEGDINAVRRRTYRWKDQPLWPTKKIAFTASDRTNRRKLIEALFDIDATDKQRSIGNTLLKCSKEFRCGSPLCNSCRTSFQDAFEERVFRYFGATNQSNLFSLTLLDNLTYDPINDAHEQIRKLRISVRGCLQRHFQKSVRAFGAFEIDVKRPDLNEENSQAVDLLRRYGFQKDAGRAYMPHLHAIIELDGISAREFRAKLRSVYTKPSQITVAALRSGNTKEENLTKLARYPIKFRYQFADNILRNKPSYGSRFDDDTLRTYAEVVHAIKGSVAVRGFEFNYNLSA
jgi:hypothetical protein